MKPRYFDETPANRVLIDPSYQVGATYYPPTLDHCDPALYISRDLESGMRISGEHHSVYIGGKMLDNSYISVREGCVSASSLGKDSDIRAGMFILISDINLSRNSRNFQSASGTDPLIIVVPEEKRAEIFDFLMKKFYRDYKKFIDPELPETMKLLEHAFPTVPIQAIRGGSARSASRG
jgi:hypothetical protein